MRAKWNPPIIETDTDFIEQTPDGWRQGVRMIFCDEDVQMFRQGYKCIECLEPLEVAFPEKCPNDWCEFPIKEAQSQVFAERFAGLLDRKGQINEDDELERLARQRHEREIREGLKTKGIVIPRNAKL